MDKYVEALNSISNYEIWHDETYDDDGYSNFDDYTEYPFDDSEDIKLLSKLINKYDILNKGIDELIKQCENEILEYEEFFKPNSKIHQLIFSEDEYYATINFRNKLKKLKGE